MQQSGKHCQHKRTDRCCGSLLLLVASWQTRQGLQLATPACSSGGMPIQTSWICRLALGCSPSPERSKKTRALKLSSKYKVERGVVGQREEETDMKKTHNIQCTPGVPYKKKTTLVYTCSAPNGLRGVTEDVGYSSTHNAAVRLRYRGTPRLTCMRSRKSKKKV